MSKWLLLFSFLGGGGAISQKTREGCGCFRGQCGSSGGKLRESPGKIAGKFLPNCQMLQILGFRAPGKENLPGTLGCHSRDLVPTFRAGCFLKSTVPAFSSFSEFHPRTIPGQSRDNPVKKLFVCFLVCWHCLNRRKRDTLPSRKRAEYCFESTVSEKRTH